MERIHARFQKHTDNESTHIKSKNKEFDHLTALQRTVCHICHTEQRYFDFIWLSMVNIGWGIGHLYRKSSWLRWTLKSFGIYIQFMCVPLPYGKCTRLILKQSCFDSCQDMHASLHVHCCWLMVFIYFKHGKYSKRWNSYSYYKSETACACLKARKETVKPLLSIRLIA